MESIIGCSGLVGKSAKNAGIEPLVPVLKSHGSFSQFDAIHCQQSIRIDSYR
ncbi:hypothetical protein [Vibrio neptunius]|uniref:Transposase n=1 Tax=Vibrio neptunius TaxID=170651 RepID=A0ABS2ZWU1_9VIBR|nr:hypothetical protein [Vibrio neptunius]MBN3492191.1 hypothetical protein [Vibrio neptunius]MBN3514688.1 hypothetical protein [Vibrio neptunius]MBN3549186.1 hypothetical protein [Vibrio neptunius]MBN3576711.1 hypothetical protein [Vibrio neptunius]MCH9870375.1 hypothetical protein [Vibrio neptunius]